MERGSYRSGYEFSGRVKQLARERAQGMCEHPEGCPHQNNNTVDHLTAICIGRRLGMERGILRSLDNAQMLCDEHDREKQIEERWIKQQLDFSGTPNPFNNYSLAAY